MKVVFTVNFVIFKMRKIFKIFDLRIYDIMGRLVLSEDKISQSFIISGNTLSKGTYILHLSHARGIIT